MDQMNKWLNLVAIQITGIVSGFMTTGRYEKWYQPIVLHDAAVHSMH